MWAAEDNSLRSDEPLSHTDEYLLPIKHPRDNQEQQHVAESVEHRVHIRIRRQVCIQAVVDDVLQRSITDMMADADDCQEAGEEIDPERIYTVPAERLRPFLPAAHIHRPIAEGENGQCESGSKENEGTAPQIF